MQALSADFCHGTSTGRHSHDQAQLIHASQGVMRVATDQGEWVIPGGHALWVPAGVVHEVHMSGAVSMRTLLVPDGADGGLPVDCQMIEVNDLLRQLILATSRPTPQPASAPAAEPCTHALRLQHLVALIGMELRHARRVPLQVPLPRDRRLHALCSALLDEPAQDMSLEQGGVCLNMSARSLARLCQRELGMSFGEWRLQARMVLAARCLASGMPILNVALEHGYQNPGAFAAAFRRTFGHSPREWQRKAREH